MQMQMAIMGITKCYFVVWSKLGVWFELVDFDADLWKADLSKLLVFHQHLLLEFIEMRLPRGLPSIRP
jgi:hypothetical protein